MLIQFDLPVFFVVLNQIKTGDVVLYFDLARQIGKLGEERGTLVISDGMNYCLSSLKR